MTRAESIALKIADEWLERELINTEILLIDLGATAEELERALGPDGFCRKMLEEDRDVQIAEMTRLFNSDSAVLH